MSFDLARWLAETALPRWREAGFDRTSGLFVERLDLDGRPLREVPVRVMVQARQIFVFALAAERGWHAGAEIAERAGDAMLRVFRDADEAGWVFSVAADGRPVDTSRDLYAQAFVLLALAWLKRLTGRDHWLDLADSTLRFLDARLATPATGGYAEALPATAAPRRQNPHMHLFEALLALAEVNPGRGYHERAEAMAALLTSRFLLGPKPVLVEYFDQDLRPLVAAPYAYEPGHHFEWAWLLAQQARLRRAPAPGLASRLRDSALREGVAGDGTIFDEVGGDGTPLSRATRLWPYTEAVRAVALDLDGTPAAHRLGAAKSLAAALQARFLAPACDGCWIDRLDAEARPLSTFVPASSLYHIAGATAALADLEASAHGTDASTRTGRNAGPDTP